MSRSPTPEEASGGEWRSAAGRLRFGKELRLRNRSEFLAVQRTGRRRHAPHFILVSVARPSGRLPRLGVTVSREVGHAVARNRVKRRIREVFRHHRQEIRTPKDLVVIAKRGAEKLSYAEVEKELASLLAG